MADPLIKVYCNKFRFLLTPLKIFSKHLRTNLRNEFRIKSKFIEVFAFNPRKGWFHDSKVC